MVAVIAVAATECGNATICAFATPRDPTCRTMVTNLTDS